MVRQTDGCPRGESFCIVSHSRRVCVWGGSKWKHLKNNKMARSFELEKPNWGEANNKCGCEEAATWVFTLIQNFEHANGEVR